MGGGGSVKREYKSELPQTFFLGKNGNLYWFGKEMAERRER